MGDPCGGVALLPVLDDLGGVLDQRRDARPLSHQLSIKAPTAEWIWQTVTSGFFSPQSLAAACQEQRANTRQDQMPLEADVMPALPLVEPDLLLLVAKTPLHAPPRKGDQEQRLDARLGRRVATKNFTSS